jgi:YidC/Oxa1 family membrane protein insertase
MGPTPYQSEEAVMNLDSIAHPVSVLAKSSGGITLDPIAKPIAAVLAFFYGLVPNYGVAIILLTVAVMIILTPLTIKQTRSMLVMQKLQPELKKLQEIHKNDRQALNEAVMAMYKEHNASPLGGCLPMILPFPVFFALFRVLEGLSRKVNGVSSPKYLSASTRMYQDIQTANPAKGGTLKAFGMDLSKSAGSAGGTFLHTLPFFVLLLLMVGTQFYQQRQLTSRNPQAAQGQQAQIMKFFPLLFGVLSIRFPAGVVVYWTVSNIIRIFQQWAMYRWDPKVKALVVQDIKEVEAKTREIEDKPPTRPRLRDLLGGAANQARGTDPKAGGKPGVGKPGASKPGGGRPTGSKPGRGTTSGGRPAGSAGGKQAGSAGSAGGKPASQRGKQAAQQSNKSAPQQSNKPAPQQSNKPAPSGADKSAPNGADKSQGGQDDRTDKPVASTDGLGNKNGSPKGRTGAGAPRPGGNRGKRARRGR